MRGGIPGLAVVVAFFAVLAAFLGLGFGTGSLSTSNIGPSATQAQYTVQQANVGQSWGDGMSWAVTITNVAQTGNAPITAMLAGYKSTDIDFGFNMYSTGDCANTGRPTWEPGVGADWGHYAIQYLVKGTPTAFSGTLDGAPVTTSNATTSVVIELNGTDRISMKYCAITFGGGDAFTQGLGVPTTVYDPHTLDLIGIVPDGVLKVSLTGVYTSCDGTGSGGASGAGQVCNDLSKTANLNVLSANGGGTFDTFASTNVLSAGANINVLNPTHLVNGGKIEVAVRTGYDGPNGYTLAVTCPVPRPCGGQQDTAFGTQNVPNEIVSARLFTFSIPKGYSTNSSVNGWNTVTVVLIANYGVAAQSLPYPVVISPIYQPQQPGITYSVSSGLTYPAIGDTVTLTVYANASKGSAPIGSVQLSVFYAVPGESPTSAPGCATGASYWVTACPYAVSPGNLTLTGNNAVLTYSFKVQPPIGATAIVASAIGESTTNQGNVSNPLYIPIKPSTCPKGAQCDPYQTLTQIWQEVGPILLAALIILGAAIVALYTSLGPRGKVVVMVVAVGFVAVGFVFAFIPGLFALGAPLG